MVYASYLMKNNTNEVKTMDDCAQRAKKRGRHRAINDKELAALYESNDLIKYIASRYGVSAVLIRRGWARLGLNLLHRRERIRLLSQQNQYGKWRVIRRVWLSKSGDVLTSRGSLSRWEMKPEVYLECECLCCHRISPVLHANLRAGRSNGCANCRNEVMAVRDND
jgi:hypothetical protein